MTKQLRKSSAGLVRTAARTLNNPRASFRAKSNAGKVLANQTAKIRTIKPAPKVGSISRSVARHAARIVSASRKK